MVIVNWNTRDHVIRCLESLSACRSGPELEIVVVDNGSTDSSAAEIIRRFPDVRVIALTENVGFVAANNLAWPSTTGEAVLFLNPDTEVRPEAVGRLWESLWSNDRRGVVGGQLLNSDGTLQQSFLTFPGVLDIVCEHTISARLYGWIEGRRTRLQRAAPVSVIRGADLMIRRALLQELRGFDGRIFMYSEETDLCRRAHILGWKIWFEPSAVIVHHERRSMRLQSSEVVMYHYLRSKRILIETHMTGWRRETALKALRLGISLRLFLSAMAGSERKDRLRMLQKALGEDIDPIHGRQRGV